MSEIAPLAPDPADKVGDDFGGTAATGHRSGYGSLETRLERILRFAKKGATLAAGEGALICQHYEEQLAVLKRDAARFAFVATDVLSDTIIGLVDTSEEASIAAAENGREEVTDADRVYALRVAVDSVLKSPPTDAALTPTPEQP